MLFLTAVQNSQPDYVALAIVAVFAMIVVVMTLRKRFSAKTSASQPTAAAAPIAQADQPAAPGSAGQVKLHSVEPKTAAMLMAIVAKKTGKPLNELRFISIKEAE